MRYKKYYLYGFWQDNHDNDTFYLYGIKLKKALYLILIGITPILLAFISAYIKAVQLIYLFIVLSAIVSPVVVRVFINTKVWFTYNRRDKQINFIYSGNEIPSNINNETIIINKNQFIDRSGFDEK